MGAIALWAMATATAILLVGCNPVFPSGELVERALSMRVSQTQNRLSQQFAAAPSEWHIERLSIDDREFVPIETLPGFHLRGRYTLVLQWPGGRIARRRYPFDIYLQRQNEGKTWRLARPLSEGDESANFRTRWATEFVPPLGWQPLD